MATSEPSSSRPQMPGDILLESGYDVVILHGEARELRSPDRALAERLAEASQ